MAVRSFLLALRARPGVWRGTGELDGVARAAALGAGPRVARRRRPNGPARGSRASTTPRRASGNHHADFGDTTSHRGGGGGTPALSSARQRACNAPSPPSSPKSGSPPAARDAGSPRCRVQKLPHHRFEIGNGLGNGATRHRPPPPQEVRDHLRLAVARERALLIPAGSRKVLGRPEVREVPDVLPNHKVALPDHVDQRHY